MVGYICTAERNGEVPGYCLDENGGIECYAYWGNTQQLHCPKIDIAGDVVLSMPPGTNTETYNAVAAERIRREPQGTAYSGRLLGESSLRVEDSS